MAIVDYEELSRNSLARSLAFAGYRVIAEASGEDLIERYRSGKRVDLVLLDVDMPGLDGYATLRALNEIDPKVRAIMFSGHPNDARAQQARSFGAMAYLQKPCEGRNVIANIEAALHSSPLPRRRSATTLNRPPEDR